MKLVDVHIHLSDAAYQGKVEELLEDARRSEVVALISNSMDLESSLRSLQLAERNPELVFAALGIHPWNVKKLLENEVQKITELVLQRKNKGKIVAVGEIGLDSTYAGDEKFRELQREVFDKMLHAAEKASLPVIVHSRGTTAEIMSLLPSYGVKRVLLHWFSRPISLLPKIVDRGYYITEGPPSVFSKGVREIVRRVPLTNLMTETDGPVRYMGPFKGKTTSPSFIRLIVKAIAELKDVDENFVADQILQNFTTFFEVPLV